MTTPSLLLGWIIATVVVLGAGLLATLGTGKPLVELLAPAVAAAGIAYDGARDRSSLELSRSMAVSDRMVLLVRALAVFGLNAVWGLAAAAASGAAAAVTFGWLVPMTAVCALALAAATLSQSANVGVAAGLGGWVITVLSARAAGPFTAAFTDSAFALSLPGLRSVLRRDRRVCDPDPERNAMNIEITGLTRRFGRNQAVAGVDLETGPGVFGPLGPNG